MGSLQNTVLYCCVSKGGQICYAYNGGSPGIENLARLCLEKTPSYHRWYFQTVGKKVFGFLMDGGYIYFAIANEEGLNKTGVLHFLEHLRDEFKKVSKRERSMSNLDSLCLQEQLIPVIHHLVSSLESVSRAGSKWQVENPSGFGELSSSPCNSGSGQSTSTKAPLLGKSSKQEKRRTKDHVVDMRDIELEEHCNNKSTEKGVRVVDTGSLDPNNQGPSSASSISLQKDFGSMRFRSTSSNRKKWCRQVRIILAVDAVVCLVLFGIWLGICGGLECIH